MIDFDKYQKQAIKLSLDVRYKRIFISGVAGSGKSAIIKYLKNYFMENNINYDIVAPTNSASKNIGGKTLHSTFKITPYENIEAKTEDEFTVFDNFGDEQLGKYDTVLIVDEVSMIGKTLLSKTLDNSIYTKMILFGDLEQLPPVKDTKVDYSKYVDCHIHLQNNYRATNPIVSKWIKEFRDTKRLNTNIPKWDKKLFDRYTYIIGYSNKGISKIERELIIYKKGVEVTLFNSIHSKGEKIYDNGDIVRLYKEAPNYMQVKIEDLSEELNLNDIELDFFNDSILTTFIIDDSCKHDKYPNTCIVGDYEMYKKILELRFKYFIEYISKLMKKYNANKTKIWQMYQNKKLSNEEIFLLKNIYMRYINIKTKPFSRHKQFITSYKAQGKAYNKVVVLVDDIPDNDNMYVAISRSKEELYLY